jgi:hypothetical protein
MTSCLCIFGIPSARLLMNSDETNRRTMLEVHRSHTPCPKGLSTFIDFFKKRRRLRARHISTSDASINTTSLRANRPPLSAPLIFQSVHQRSFHPALLPISPSQFLVFRLVKRGLRSIGQIAGITMVLRSSSSEVCVPRHPCNQNLHASLARMVA